ncbi:MAG TPA: nuclear transport factor 2 family protein [Microbacteriaceae bacterium]|nr:nuclear transport factor 2 family protein [Microbacteriaceae bacterium]
MLNADDRLAIVQTLSLNGHLVDDGDVDRFGETFTSDVVYELGAAGVGTARGLEAVCAAAQGMAKAGAGPLAHHVTNIVITGGEGDTATARSKVLLVMRTGKLESAIQRDTLRRDGGTWRISHRVIAPLGDGAKEGER